MMSAVLFFAWRSFPKSVGGLGHWMACTVAALCSGLLNTFRGVAPDWLTVVGSNGFFLAALMLAWIGTRSLFGLPYRRGWLIVLLATVSATTFWWVSIQPALQPRLITVPAVIALFYGLQCHLIWRHGQRNFASLFYVLVMAAGLLTSTLRSATAIAPSLVPETMFSQAPLQQIYYLALTALSLLQPIAFFILASDRLHRVLDGLAKIDPLTGLLNRRALEGLVAPDRRSGGRMAVLAIDLDHFKAINDRHGHDMGDRVLQRFAQVVGATIRREDHFARMGGEEFVLLLKETDTESAMLAANRVRDAVAAGQSPDLPVFRCSIGVAIQDRAEDSFTDLLKRADAALYRAKALGRDRIEAAQAE